MSSNQKNVYDQLEWLVVSQPPVCDTSFDRIKQAERGEVSWGGNVVRQSKLGGWQRLVTGGLGQCHLWMPFDVQHPPRWHFRVPQIFHHFLPSTFPTPFVPIMFPGLYFSPSRSLTNSKSIAKHFNTLQGLMYLTDLLILDQH